MAPDKVEDDWRAVPEDNASDHRQALHNATMVYQKERLMDKQRVRGIGKQISGLTEETIGKVNGDMETEAEGVAEKTVGKTEKNVSGTHDKVRDKFND